MLTILTLQFVIQIALLILVARKPTVLRWRLLYLIEAAFVSGVLLLMVYYSRISEKIVIDFSEYWIAYLYCFCAVCVYCVTMLATAIVKAMVSRKHLTLQKKRHPLVQFAVGVVCGLFSFAVAYYFVTEYFMLPSPDYIWCTLRVLLPVVTVVILVDIFEGFSPGCIWIGCIVQYAILTVFAELLCPYLLHGRNLQGGLCGWTFLEYIGYNFAYPIVVTLVQFVLLLVIRLVGPRKKQS